MKLNNIKWLAVLSLLSILSACSGDDRPDTGDGGITGTGFQIDGNAQKGPFLKGSSVNVTQLTAKGESTDKSLLTQTKDSLGNFSFVMSNEGPTLITTNGYHYNELTGELSSDQLTLRAIYNVSSQQEQSANVNVLTHLIHSRVLQLMRIGVDVNQAIAQAEKEWLESFKSIVDTEVSVGFSQLNLYEKSGGSIQKGNDYLLFTSAIFYQYATTLTNGDGTKLGAQLVQLLNNTADDFKTDGDIDNTALVDQLIVASTQINFETVKKHLENLSRNIAGVVLPVADFKKLLTQVVILSPADNQIVSNTTDVKFSIPQGLTNASYELLVGGEKAAELNSTQITAQDIESGILTIQWQPYYFSSNVNGRKSLVIQASAGGSRALSNIVNVDISPSVNQVISATAPINNSLLRSQSQVELNWSAVSDAKKYTVQLSNDNFRTLIKDAEVTEPKFIANELTQGQYQWRVKATNQYDKTGPWSGVFNFEIKGSVAPTELSSQVSYQDKKYSVSLAWKADKPTDSYQLQIAKDDSFDELVESPTASSNELIKEMALGKYYWRVKVDNQDGFDGDWSEATELSVGVFEKNFGQKGDYAKDVIATQDGGALVLAVSKAIDKTDGDDWLVKFNPIGNIEWEYILEKEGSPCINEVKQFSDGYFYAVGQNSEDERGYLVKINSSFNSRTRILLEKEYLFNGSVKEQFFSLAELNEKIYIVGKRSTNKVTLYSADMKGRFELNNIDISRIEESLKLEKINEVEISNDGNLLLSGRLIPPVLPFEVYPGSPYLIKIDENGVLKWSWYTDTGTFYLDSQKVHLEENGSFVFLSPGMVSGIYLTKINSEGEELNTYLNESFYWGAGGVVGNNGDVLNLINRNDSPAIMKTLNFSESEILESFNSNYTSVQMKSSTSLGVLLLFNLTGNSGFALAKIIEP